MPASPTAPGRATGGCAGCGGLSQPLSRVLAQSETDAERLKAIGCLPERVTVAGNLKFDVRAAEEAEATRLLKALAAGLRSSWPAARSKAKKPRCSKPGRAARSRSATGDGPRAPPSGAISPRWPRCWRNPAFLGQALGLALQPRRRSKPLNPGQIVLLDTIGELASVYSLASVAFVGGSLVPAGGHNPLEPAQFGVPIVMGPHYANFRAITDDLLAHQALRIAAKEELAAT
jgi:3-deoxy-D-manno-octulosonic-acid transferase